MRESECKILGRLLKRSIYYNRFFRVKGKRPMSARASQSCQTGTSQNRETICVLERKNLTQNIQDMIESELRAKNCNCGQRFRTD